MSLVASVTCEKFQRKVRFDNDGGKKKKSKYVFNSTRGEITTQFYNDTPFYGFEQEPRPGNDIMNHDHKTLKFKVRKSMAGEVRIL